MSSIDDPAPRLMWVGDRHLRVSFGVDQSPTHLRVRSALRSVRSAGIHALEDATPAHATLLLAFDPNSLDAERAESEVARALQHARAAGAAVAPRTVDIPVCYEGDCAPDIADVARLHGLSPAEVAAAHAGASYEVRFIGFSPGFGYLSGLPSALATPRLESPRARVQAGSVGIAADQTAVYPSATPGGWRLIGRTPVAVFDPHREPPALLEIGDRVRFVPIGYPQFTSMLAGGT